MIGDPTGTITRNFGVMIEEAGLADRGTFVIDPQGVIQIVEINAGGIGRDALELLRKVKAAQYVASHPGEVCPAKWKEGDATWPVPGSGRQNLSLPALKTGPFKGRSCFNPQKMRRSAVWTSVFCIRSSCRPAFSKKGIRPC